MMILVVCSSTFSTRIWVSGRTSTDTASPYEMAASPDLVRTSLDGATAAPTLAGCHSPVPMRISTHSVIPTRAVNGEPILCCPATTCVYSPPNSICSRPTPTICVPLVMSGRSGSSGS